MRPVEGSWLPVLALCALVADCARSTPIPDPLPELRSAFPVKMPLDRASTSLTARGARITIYAPSECAALLQEFEHRLRHRTQERSRRIFRPRMMGSHPIRIFAHEECNGRDARRNYSPPVLAILVGFEGRGMRRQAAPSHHACQAKLIEVRRIVVRDSAREHKPFPRARRNFKALQLPDYF